jgi:hypothetical protein
MDVVTAFLNPPIDNNNVYMSMPLGVKILDERFSKNLIVRLKKALYGLKQAPRLWYEHINSFLLPIKFTQSTAHPNLYIMDTIPFLLHVDDILISGNDVKSAKDQLQQSYKMKELGIARRFLSIEITQRNGITSISQKAYVNTIIERFGKKDACHISSPMDPDIDSGNSTCQDRTADKDLYMYLIGSLMYIALATRPDIAFAVTALSRYNEIPLQMHLTAAKRVLRYLNSTMKLELHF